MNFQSTSAAGRSSRLLTDIDRMRADVREFCIDDGGKRHYPTAYDKAALRVFLHSEKICSKRPERSDYLDDHSAKMALIPQVYAELEALGDEVTSCAQASLWAGLWTMPVGHIQKLPERLRDPTQVDGVHVQLARFNNLFPLLVKTSKYFSGHMFAADDALGSSTRTTARRGSHPPPPPTTRSIRIPFTDIEAKLRQAVRHAGGAAMPEPEKDVVSHQAVISVLYRMS
ncbi:hypothetical protein LZ31DRAFT_598913 [Colletotrichum somersetense]|nr:hypothetical protein LZ31DRAFT_598913 [Colletotrichum somersetense]